MKKRILALVATAIMVVSSTVMTFADTTTGLIGQFKFDGDLSNSVEGAEAGTPVAKGNGGTVGAATEHTFNYVDGVDGTAIYLNEGGDTTGVNLNIKPTDGKAYTISVWAKCLGCNFANPIVWAGKSAQGGGECWVGIWPQLLDNYSKGPCLGSNGDGDASGTVDRVDIYPTAEDGTQYGAGAAEDPKTFDWINITITVDNGIGCLYYNGILVGISSSIEILPDIIADGDDTVSIYLGANGWDAPFNGYIDNLYVYDRVLSGSDVKELVEATNVNGVTIDTSYYAQAGEVEEIETTSHKPTTANKNNVDYLVPIEPETTAEAEEGLDPTIIIVAAVVVVVIVVVVVVAVVASKKKTKNDDDDEE